MTGAYMGPRPPIRFRALEKVRVRPPSLVQVCLKRVAENFLKYDNIEKKLGNRKQLEDVYAMLDLDMPIYEAATRIDDENYWKRRAQAQHRNAQVEKHGMSWKQTFLELDLQEALETLTLDDGVEELERKLEGFKQQVLASKLYVFQLSISQFPSHVDLSFIFDSLPALCSFSITYGNKRLGMAYERAQFGMKISDAQFLARNVRVSQTLVSLALPSNMIDDELVKVLMGGLSYGHMLTQLDLSHNKIGDRGARRLASLLDPDYCLQTFDLSDNQIHANGCMHLGAHLAENVTCETLNLRLNRCEDNGVSHLFQDLCVNKYLKSLNIACNDLTVRCLPYMNAMISENEILRDLDLSANPLYTEAETEEGRYAAPAGSIGADVTQMPALRNAPASGEDANKVEGEGEEGEEQDIGGVSIHSPFGVFARCVMRSQSLLRVDLRQCGLPEELAERITTTVKHRELRHKGIPVDAYERSKQVQEETQRLDEGEEEEAEGEGDEEEAAAEGAEGEGGGAEGTEKEGAQEEAAEEA